MSTTTPTVQQISDNIVNQIASAISQTVPLLPKVFTRVLAKALAAVFILVYKYAGFSMLQMFVATASAKDTVVNGITVNPLTEWGRLFGVGDPNDATRWEGTTTITVLNQTGTLAAGSQLLRSSTGVLYLTLSAVTLDAATKTVTVRASSDQGGGGGAGTIGNLNDGDIISFANAQANVATDTAVASTTVTGADAEDPEVYRQRIIDRAQQQPQGGAYADYRLWGSDVEGILNIYPYTGQPGEVDVYVEATEASSGSADGIPTQAQLDDVAEAIELDDAGLASNRPANALVNTVPILRTGFNVTITGLAGAEDPAEAEQSIEDAVDEFLRSREPFIVGLSFLPREDRVTQGSVAGIADQAASTLGVTIVQTTLFVGLTQINAYTLDNGEKAKLGTATFI